MVFVRPLWKQKRSIIFSYSYSDSVYTYINKKGNFPEKFSGDGGMGVECFDTLLIISFVYSIVCFNKVINLTLEMKGWGMEKIEKK